MAKSNAKPGPKRQLGERYPSGKLKPEARRGAGTPPAQIKRIVEMAKRGAADPMLGTAIGWLRLHDIISNRQVAAAEAYAKCRGKYDRAIEAAARSSASPSYEAGYGRSPTIETEKDRLRALNAVFEFGEMLDVLVPKYPAGTIINGRTPKGLGDSAKRVLDLVCVEDQHPMADQLETLLTALDRIVHHLKLTI